MEIRKGKASDFQVLWRILKDTPELQSDPEGDTYDKKWLKEILSSPKENLILIAENNEKFIGFAIVHYLKSVKQSLVNDLFVIKEYRKQGIASKLMKACEKDAKQKHFRYITGFVRTNNKKMQKLKELNE